MHCPECGEPGAQVKDSRKAPTAVQRRRICRSCGHRWNTIERTERSTAIERLRAEISGQVFEHGAKATRALLDDLLLRVEARVRNG